MKKTATQVLEDQWADEAARYLKEEIDREVLFEILEEFGWTRIELPSKWLPVNGIELHEWREQNLKGQWKAHENVWLFEKPEDAVIFSLRWS